MLGRVPIDAYINFTNVASFSIGVETGLIAHPKAML